MGGGNVCGHHRFSVATGASFAVGRYDGRESPRGGLVGLGDLEDEDRRHLAVLFAAGPAPPSTMVYSQWTGPMPMASAFLPFQSTNRGLPPLSKNSTPRPAGQGGRTRGKGGNAHPAAPAA